MRNEYELQLERRARKNLNDIPDIYYERIQEAIDALAREPRPHGCVTLRGSAPLWRLRVAGYRIVYAVFDQERLVKVIRIERRTEKTYRRI